MSNNLTGRETVAVGVKGFAKNAETADIAALSGALLIASGDVSSPLAFIDISLPEAFRSFRIEWSGVQFSADSANLSAAISTDGGVTFINDATNFDSYLQALTGRNFAIGGTLSSIDKSLDSGFADAMIDFAPAGNVTAGDKLLLANQGSVNELILLDPGSASLNIRGTSYGWAEGLDTESPNPGMVANQATVAFAVNRRATVPPTFARANLIRFQPYGNGDVNPPTSGQTIVVGSYRVWGVN